MDRVPSEHDVIDSYAGEIVPHGPRRRLAVAVPSSVPLPTGDVIRLRLPSDTTTYFARPEAFADTDRRRLSGAFHTPDAARTPGTADNCLRAWLANTDLGIGRTIYIDVIEPGFKYGLRGPGDRLLYTLPNQSNSGLNDIATRLQQQSSDQ